MSGEPARWVRKRFTAVIRRPAVTLSNLILCDHRGPPDPHPGRVSLIEWAGTVTHPLTLIPAVGSKAQKLPLHRIDLGEICRDEVIAAALAGHHLKTTVHEGRGGT